MGKNLKWRIILAGILILGLISAGFVCFWVIKNYHYQSLFFELSGQSKKIEADLYRARILAEQGKLEEAFQIADSLLKKNDRLAPAHIVVGVVYLQRGDYFQGDEHLRQAVRLGLKPDDLALTYFNLGVSAKQQYRPEMAAAYFQEALKVNPKMQVAREGLEMLQSEDSYS